MKKFQYILIIFLAFYFTGHSTAAERRYVSDSFTITLRTGPSNENKITKRLRSGQSLDVLETQEEWSRVEVADNSNEKTEGWVRNQYLIDRVPYSIEAETLSAENKKLKTELAGVKNQLNSLKKEKNTVSGLFSENSKELTSLKKDYEELKRSSSEYLKLKAEHESNILKLQSTEERLKEVELENAKISDSKDYLWFGTGATVLLFGFIIGSILGRQTRKKSSSYY